MNKTQKIILIVFAIAVIGVFIYKNMSAKKSVSDGANRTAEIKLEMASLRDKMKTAKSPEWDTLYKKMLALQAEQKALAYKNLSKEDIAKMEAKIKKVTPVEDEL